MEMCCFVKLIVAVSLKIITFHTVVMLSTKDFVGTVSDRAGECNYFCTHPVAVTANCRTFEGEHKHMPLLPTLTFLIL